MRFERIFWIISINQIVITLAVLLLPLSIDAEIYYVDNNRTDSSDQNSGTISNPWKTIQHGADQIQPGDTVLIRNGVYYETVLTKSAGQQDKYLTFMAYPGENPVLDGTDVSESSSGLRIYHDYVRITGLEVRNWSNGIWIDGAGFTEVIDCEVHEAAFGIGAANGAHDFTISNTEIHHFDFYGFDASPSGGADCYQGSILNCTAHTARVVGQNTDGFALGHGSQSSFTFIGCITYDVYDGFDISSRQTSLEQCTAYNCSNGGYKLWQDEITLINCLSYNNVISNLELDWDGESGKVRLINCTFHNSEVFNIWVENSADTLEMYNCILSGGDNIGLAFEQHSIENYRGNNNLFANDNLSRAIAVGYTDEFSVGSIEQGDWAAYCQQDSQSVTALSDTVIFMDPIAHDFQLRQNSPAIDAGRVDFAPAVDFSGNPRPAGAGYDIGAFEFHPSTVVFPVPVEKGISELNDLSNHPNPFNSSTTIRFSVQRQVDLHLEIVDVRGRKIRTLVNGVHESGGFEVVWDGCDKAGSAVASGVYYIRLQDGGRLIQVRSIVLIR